MSLSILNYSLFNPKGKKIWFVSRGCLRVLICMAYYMYIIIIMSFLFCIYGIQSFFFIFIFMTWSIICSFCVWHIVWTNTRICQFYSIWPAFAQQYWVAGAFITDGQMSEYSIHLITQIHRNCTCNCISSLILQLQWPSFSCFLFFFFLFFFIIDEWYFIVILLSLNCVKKLIYVSACKMNMSLQTCCRFEPHVEEFEHMWESHVCMYVCM